MNTNSPRLVQFQFSTITMKIAIVTTIQGFLRKMFWYHLIKIWIPSSNFQPRSSLYKKCHVWIEENYGLSFFHEENYMIGQIVMKLPRLLSLLIWGEVKSFLLGRGGGSYEIVDGANLFLRKLFSCRYFPWIFLKTQSKKKIKNKAKKGCPNRPKWFRRPNWVFVSNHFSQCTSSK